MIFMMLLLMMMMITTAPVSLTYHGRKLRQHKLGKGLNKTDESQLDIRPELHAVSSAKEMGAPRCLRKVKKSIFRDSFHIFNDLKKRGTSSLNL